MKQKWMQLALPMAFLLTNQHLAFAQGPVSSQDPGVPQYLEHNAGRHLRDGGYGPQEHHFHHQFVPSYVDDTDPVYEWCNSVVRELRFALQQSRTYQFREQFDSAAKVLVDALENAKADPYLRKGPFAARAIARGIKLNETLVSSTGNRPSAVRTEVYFLSAYIQFIINTAENLDLPFTIPHYDCYECGVDHEGEFEENMLQYAKDEVQIVLDVLTFTVPDESGNEAVFPIGGSVAPFINVLSQSIGFAREDIASSPFVAAYGCTLRYLGEVASFLQSGGYGDPQYDMYYAYSETSDLLSQISPHCGCFSWHRDHREE